MNGQRGRRMVSSGAVSCDDVTPVTPLILANALYFKGTCLKKFKARCTKDYDFYLLDGCLTRVPFMTNYEPDQYIETHNGFKVLQLPYKQGCDFGRSFSMCFFLPDMGDGLPALTERACSEPGFLDCHNPQTKVEVG
ncbi:hypothetical protein CDL15_Pgr004578 [Punica granatum]|uniref:Serpin domain-containing protein n=1 Tax=Punica granatum TaxID=22663 RepID=A0A218WRG6_PUNGR|nr:hypothetical protein CDL15_Pgr004578 [Punica granatum]